MKRKLNFGMVLTVITLSILMVGCNASSKKQNTETHEQMAQTVYTCPMHPEVEQNESGNCPTCGMKLEEKVATMQHSNMQMNDSIYTCPMHPEVKKSEAGSCPQCGMDLAKKESDLKHSHEEHMH